MAVVIRMKREGRKNLPSYRLHVTDTRSPRDGRTIEKLGFYDPRAKTPEKVLQFNKERAVHWVKLGARVSDTIHSMFRKAGVYQGLPAPKKRDRSGRSKRTKTGEHRAAIQKVRAESKAARPAHRRKPKVVEKKKPGT